VIGLGRFVNAPGEYLSQAVNVYLAANDPTSRRRLKTDLMTELKPLRLVPVRVHGVPIHKEVVILKKTYTQKIEDVMPVELQFHLFGEGSPKVFFSGGIHGGEATGIYVAQRVVDFLDTNKLLKGSVKLLPVANVPAFRRLQRTSPYDELDLNRIFPGKKDSTPTMAIAEVIWEEARDTDYIVDLHCCGLWGSSYTLAMYEEFDHSRKLAEMLDIPAVIQSGGTRGQLFTEASHSGTPAVIIELPGGSPDGVIHIEAAKQCFQALLNLLRLLEMLPGEARKPEPTFYGKLEPLRAPGDGVFLPVVKPGSPINKDEMIGMLGNQPVVAPFDGIAIAVRPASYVFKERGLAHVAPRVE
jgi:predicted deacylase